MSYTIENVLILQGRGSLGAFGCGVFKALASKNIKIDIVAGTSIGAVNAAIIAGGKQEEHPEKVLEQYWLELAKGTRSYGESLLPQQPGAKVVHPVPKEYNVFAYIINGEAIFGPAEKQKTAKAVQMVIFDSDGEEVVVSAPATDDTITTTNKNTLDVLLIGGVALNEPVARYGPFVMNTKEEILKAIEDYRNGNMGEIAIQ